jgi:hypothetical protein
LVSFSAGPENLIICNGWQHNPQEKGLKYPSVGWLCGLMGVPNPSARKKSVQTGSNAKLTNNKIF